MDLLLGMLIMAVGQWIIWPALPLGWRQCIWFLAIGVWALLLFAILDQRRKLGR